MQSIRNKYFVITVSLLLCSVFQKEFSLLAQPVITSQPTSVTTCSNTAALLCVSTSAGSPTYQWKMCSTSGGSYVNVANGTPAGATYANTTSSCLSVTFSSLTTYYFKCDVTSGGTTTSSFASVTTVAGSGCGTGVKTYGSSTAAGYLDMGLGIVEASDGNGVVMVGQSAGIDPTGLTDAAIFKINTTMNGALSWCRGLGSTSGGNEDVFYSVIKNTSGNYIVTGQVMDASNSLQTYLAEFPKAGGGATWTRKIGKSNYEWGNQVIQHSNGDYYVAGYSAEDGGGGVYSGQMWSGRFGSASGTKVWTRHIGFGAAIGTTPDEVANGLVETGSGTTAGDIILVGNTTKVPSTSNEEIAIVRQNASGALLSARALAPSSGTGNDVGTAIIRAATDGEYVIVGYTNSSGAGGYDFYIAKLKDDASLTIDWQKTIGTAGNDYALAVTETSDGGYVIAGYTGSLTGTSAAYFVKVSQSGALVWTRNVTITAGDANVAWSVKEMSDQTIVACGYTKADPDCDIAFFALNSDGSIASTCTNASGGTMNTPTFVYNDLADNNADAAGTSGTEATNNNNVASWLLSNTCGVIILPIELKDFSVKCDGDNRLVSWVTNLEQNNNFFVVEQSKDGVHWETLGKVKGMGNSITEHSYQQKFQKKSDEYKLFRLRQVDFNGHETVFESVTLTCVKKNSVLEGIYPNPANSDINLQTVPGFEGELFVEIYDVTGRVLINEVKTVTSDTHETEVNISEISSGVYYVKVTDVEGNTTITKLIKN